MKLYHDDMQFLLENKFDVILYYRARQIANMDDLFTSKDIFNIFTKEVKLPLDMFVNISCLKTFSFTEGNTICTGSSISNKDISELLHDVRTPISSYYFKKWLTSSQATKGKAKAYYVVQATSKYNDHTIRRISLVFEGKQSSIFSQHRLENTKTGEFYITKFFSLKRGKQVVLSFDNHLDNNLIINSSQDQKRIIFNDVQNVSEYSFVPKQNKYKQKYFVQKDFAYFTGALRTHYIEFKSMDNPSKFKILSYAIPGTNGAYTSRGQLKYKTIFDKTDKDLRHYIVWYGNGNIKSHGRYSFIGREGPFIKYNSDGSIKYKEYYLKGARFGIGTYYKDGKVKKIVDYCRKVKGTIIYKDTSL